MPSLGFFLSRKVFEKLFWSKIREKKQLVSPDNTKHLEISMPELEREYVEACYKEDRTKCILEFGSGGSTLCALRNGKTVVSVETDHKWHHTIIKKARHLGQTEKLFPLWIDVGKTMEWGIPIDPTSSHLWHTYLIKPYALIEQHNLPIDTVLIDGRFRLGTILACILFLPPPFTVLFDDYRDRESYHDIEQFITPTKMVGRMAEFQVEHNLKDKELIFRLMQAIHETG